MAVLTVGAASLTVGVTVEPAGPPSDWMAVLATGDHFGAMTDWMRENTGPRTADLLDVGGQLSINDSWLTVNEGNGRVWRDGGRWHVERYRCTNVRFYSSYVTLTDFECVGTGSRGIVGTEDQTGIVMEHFRANGGMTDNIGIYFPRATEPNQIIARNGEIRGYRVGGYAIGGFTGEWLWIHDLYALPGVHSTGSSFRSRNNRLTECLITDGTSAANNWYAENTPYTGNRVERCGFRLRETDTGPELGIYKTYEVAAPGETREVIDVCFYRGNIGNRHSGGFTRWEGNWRSIDGTPVP